MITYEGKRVGIFIDIQNLYHSAKNLFDSRVNYNELIKVLVADNKLIRALAYVVQSETILPTENGMLETTTGKSESSFFDALKKAGIELRMKDIQVYPGGAKKADWDVGMAIDAVRISDGLDVVVLLTGDGDFIPLVNYLQWGKGKKVIVAAFSQSTNGKLKEVCDKFIGIENIPKVLSKIQHKSQKGAVKRRPNQTKKPGGKKDNL
ncbi:MAG: NYN domain-containing protein [bacterium]|nr:NYN domain-containing protein [bacterium]